MLSGAVKSRSEARCTSPERELQHQIEAKENELLQLYERRKEQRKRSLQVRSRNWLGRAPQLRIRESPPVSPLRDVGTPESVALPLTGEKRHLVATALQSANAATLAATGKRNSDVKVSSMAPHEFAERLCRLRRAASSVSTHCTSPVLTPIHMKNFEEDISVNDTPCIPYENLFSGLAEFDKNARGVTTSMRHVRFSSISPQVSTFSVERSCPRSAQLDSAVPDAEYTASPFIGSCVCAGECGGSRSGQDEGNEEREVRSSPANDSVASLSGAAPSISSTQDTCISPLASRISTVLSPRSSAASYLSLLRELRSSLLNGGPRSWSGFSTSPPHPATQHSLDAGDTNTHQETFTADEEADAATPTKEEQHVTSEKLGGSQTAFDAATAALRTLQQMTERVDNKRVFTATRRSLLEADLADMLDSMVCASPIFLQRRERTHGSSARTASTLAPSTPTQAADVVDGFVECMRTEGCEEVITPLESTKHASIGRRLYQNTKKPAVLKPASTATTKPKKTVHFHASLEQSAPEASAPLRRRGRGSKNTQATPTTCVPTNMPANTCVEARGFGAGISLACGPTLHFD